MKYKEGCVKMKVCAVVCEYNPFHFGHEYMISKLKETGYAVVCIMSGNFTQRGIPGMVSKYSRAEMAVNGGADLVLELPFPYSSCNANVFCRAGVQIAESIGITDAIAFGSESGDVAELKKKAEYFLSDEYKAIQDDMLSKGGVRSSETYMLEQEKELGSNDILAVGYLKALIELNSRIEPVAIQRKGMRSNDLSGEGFLSSKSIRRIINDCIIYAKEVVPDYVYAVLTRDYMDMEYSEVNKLLFTYQSMFRMKKAEELYDCAELNEELANRIVSSSNKSLSSDDLVMDIMTKIYSKSKVMRALLMGAVGVQKASVNKPSYTVMLGANDTGRLLIKQMKKTSEIPVITKQADYTEFGDGVTEDYNLLLKADSLWNLSLAQVKESGAEMKKVPFILK